MQTRRTSVLFDPPPTRNRDPADSKPDLAPLPSRPHIRRSTSHGNSVYCKITSLLGVHPNRSELIAIVTQLAWIPLGRSEKRVKALLIRKLEKSKDKILPWLNSPQGLRSLKETYVSIMNNKRLQEIQETQGIGSPARTRTLPVEARMEFYLNQHD
jgi:hypothetical protein